MDSSQLSTSTEDRISSLPDSIICHILSFLPTEFAVTTSILSKRWNPLWLSVLTLHFHDETFKDFDSFRNFVSSVFLSRDITLPLRSFHLKCSKASNLHQHDFNRFVYAGVQRRGIENLILDIPIRVHLKIKLPPIVFSCRTLVVLHLTGLKVNDLSHVVVDFPLLKTLHLNWINLERIEYLPKLLLGCPILEELQTKYLHVVKSQRLVLEEKFQYLPNLIKANISDFTSNVLLTVVCRAKVLCAEPGMTYNMRSCQFPMYHNLTYMKLIFKHNHYGKWKWLLEVLERCPKLQNLTIHEDYGSKEEVEDNWMNPTIISECLSTQLKTCLLKGFKSTKCELQFTKHIMQNSKVLDTMSIKCTSSININVKHQMLIKLASWTRASTTCKLLFD